MCGIAGFVNFAGHDRKAALAKIRRMTDVLVHRGPDAEGFFADNYSALGHRRLAIIDIDTGQQPMADLGGQLQISFNGEIYNFQQLKIELEAAGHRFHTKSDTEVILKAYIEWGEQCVERLNGMFAFAIWDARHKRLLLARDRVGKKPLYYQRLGDTVVFASELKALTAHGLHPAEVDPESLDCYLTMGYIPAPRTIYSGVKKLLPAHILVIAESGNVERQYWDLDFSNPGDIPLDQAVDEFEELLDDAVRCRMLSEVPLGAFLSGGLDSSLVVSSMAKMQDSPVLTHTIGFENSEFTEIDVARAISSHLDSNHHELIVRPHAADILEKIAWHFDEPFADSSAVPTWYVCEMTRRSVTVALSGDGGDESFGGYTFRYLTHMLESRVRHAVPAALRSLLFGPLGSIWPASARLPKPLRLKSIFENLAVGDSEAYYRDLIWLRSDIRDRVYQQDFIDSLKGFTSFETVNDFYSHCDAIDALGRTQYADVFGYMTNDVLVKVDRMSMAHSLEVRSPLLDHRIMEFAARLPAKIKINSRKGKLPLRGLAARRLPKAIHTMPKQGFSVPAATWLRGELRPMAEDLVFDSNGIISEILRPTELRRLWNQHLRSDRDHSVFFWGLMMLGLWSRTCRVQ